MKLPVIIAVAVGILLVILIAVMMRRPAKREVIVIGEEYAKAKLAEEQRKLKGGGGNSPMPAVKYDFWRGEESLISPVKNSLDSELTELCRRFVQSDEKARANMRTSISLEEFSTLLSFSKRSAVFALREQDVNWVNNGLTAIAMIEAERTDFRDILMSLSLLYHSAKRIGADANQLFRDTAKLSEPNVATLLIGFLNRPAEEKDLRTSWGHDEVETAAGIGFIGWGLEEYHPTSDLKKIAIDIAATVAKDKYQPSSVEVAANLPSVWLESPENPSLKSVLKKVRAGASVQGDLRPNEHPSYKSQVLMVFLVETEDSRAAQELLVMSRNKRPTEHAMLGVSEGRLFCLLIGESFEQGVASFETSESLQRFSAVVTEILKRY